LSIIEIIDWTLNFSSPTLVFSLVPVQVLAESASSNPLRLRRNMGYSAFEEFDHIRTTNRNIWVALTSVFTLTSGVHASQGDWPVFWGMLALWVFTGVVLAVCRPGLKHRR
jgi:hypothetical protein